MSPRSIPPLPCAPGASPFHIKGLAYRGVLRAISSLVPGGVEGFCQSLSEPRFGEFLRQPFLASGLYDVLPMYPLTAGLAAALGVSYKEFLWTGTCEQARYDAAHVFHRLYDGAEIEQMPARVSRFEGQYFDFGRTEVHSEGPGRLILERHEVPEYISPWLTTMKAAYTEEAARILGAARAQCTPRMLVRSGTRDGFPVATISCELVWSVSGSSFPPQGQR